MKRTVFIVIGVVLIIILVAIWIWVLFFGTPKNVDEVFGDLSIGDTTDTSIINEEPTLDNEPTVNVSTSKRLRQLTTKPIIGYREVMKNASSTPVVYYIEAGTGHVFSINLTSGEEERVSATTFPSSQKGSITLDGEYVMIQSGSGFSSEYNIKKLDSASSSDSSVYTITEPIISFKATTDNTFLYAVKTDRSVIGKSFDPVKQTSKDLFTIPFREAVIDWGKTEKDTHFAYPKASSKLEGFLYEIKGGKVSRLPIDGFGLSAEGNESGVVFSRQDKERYQTYLYLHEYNDYVEFPITVIPEKCAFSENTSSLVVCAETPNTYNRETPDTWYSGEVNLSDNLWESKMTEQGVSSLSNTQSESGQSLDITNLQFGHDDVNIYFVNKNNQNLWMFERLQPLPETE
ncbi:hypothetical protein H6784_03815 [Candidatus Nomurabacteria bacterium]|nr:hypothetical protein [Candidatus Kaiserbacteria bacterium]MCB9814516.1 hypothetical protein [Candidatus Nomurabacteria bacterium]